MLPEQDRKQKVFDCKWKVVLLEGLLKRLNTQKVLKIDLNQPCGVF